MELSFRERLRILDKNVVDAISEIRKNHPNIVLDTIEDIQNGECEYYEMRNDITGDVFDVFIHKIDENGITVFESGDTSKKHVIGLFDLSSIDDRINLYENLLILIQ